MNTTDVPATPWRKSSRSTAQGGDCVEVMRLASKVTEHGSNVRHGD